MSAMVLHTSVLRDYVAVYGMREGEIFPRPVVGWRWDEEADAAEPLVLEDGWIERALFVNRGWFVLDVCAASDVATRSDLHRVRLEQRLEEVQMLGEAGVDGDGEDTGLDIDDTTGTVH